MYFNIRDELSYEGDLVFRGEQVLIPKALRKTIIDKLHQTHNGSEATIQRAKETVFWPKMRHEIAAQID